MDEKLLSIITCKRNKNIVYQIINRDNEVAGYFVLVKRKQNGDFFNVENCDSYISNVHIFEKYRRKGYATEMLKVVVNNAGCYRLCVRTNNYGALNLYYNIGFKAINSRMVFDIYEYIFSQDIKYNYYDERCYIFRY